MSETLGTGAAGGKRLALALIAAALSAVPILGAAWWTGRNPAAAPPPLSGAALKRAEAEAPHDIRPRVEALAERLAGEPDNIEGWSLLARSWSQLGEHERAAAASRRVAELRARQPRALSLQAEDLVVAADGVVTPEAKRLVEAALAADPADPPARFYDGLARAQAGAAREALAVWLELEAASGAETPYYEGLRANIDRLAAQLALPPDELTRLRQRSRKG